MKKIKIAQIGTSQNSHGNAIWNSLLKQTDIFDVAGYVMPENEKEKFPDSLECFKSYQELTIDDVMNDPEIEAVTIETEEVYLTKYAIMAANNKKHIHMEKPGGIGLFDFEKLINTVKLNNLVFSIGYMYRFNPIIKKTLNKIKNGELGKIYSVEAHMNCKHNRNTRQWLENFPGGIMFFLGCHLIDLIYQIQGEPLEVIPLNCSTGFDGVSANDYGMVIFRYPNGISFAKTCADEYGGYSRRQLVICGEKGTIEIKPLEMITNGGLYTTINEIYSNGWADPWKKTDSDIYDRYDDMIKNFAYMVRGIKENPYSCDYELNLYKLLLKSCGITNTD